MTYSIHTKKEQQIVEITSLENSIKTSSDFLDMTANIPARSIILQDHMLDNSFFDLKTGVAGEILQKVSMYRLKLGIIGDFKKYPGKSLRDFICESNKSKQVIFSREIKEALKTFGP